MTSLAACRSTNLARGGSLHRTTTPSAHSARPARHAGPLDCLRPLKPPHGPDRRWPGIRASTTAA
jgi:hypothetical protein